jgi:hypothetical protein
VLRRELAILGDPRDPHQESNVLRLDCSEGFDGARFGGGAR